jgi:hypothetical protein
VRQSPMLKISRTPASLLVLVLAVALIAPATAYSSEASTIISRCTHGKSLSGFSQQAYRRALQQVSTEISEYTNCSEQIRQAQLAAAGSHRGAGATPLGAGSAGGGTGGPGSVSRLAVTPTEQRAISNAGHVASAPVPVGSSAITPGVVHADISSAISSLPTPLLATLTFLLASALALIGGVVRDRVLARRAI